MDNSGVLIFTFNRGVVYPDELIKTFDASYKETVPEFVIADEMKAAI